MSQQPLSTQARLWLYLIMSQRERKTSTIGEQTKLGTSVPPRWTLSWRTSSSPGFCTAVTLVFLWCTRTLPRIGSPALLPSKPLGAWFLLLLPTGKCVPPPPPPDFRGCWAWALYSLVPRQLRCQEAPHHSSGDLSFRTRQKHTQTSLCFVS